MKKFFVAFLVVASMVAAVAVSSSALTLTKAQIIERGAVAADFIASNGRVPNYLNTPDGATMSTAESFYIMAKWIVSKADVVLLAGISGPASPSGSSTSGTVSLSDLTSAANTAASYIVTNKKLPSSITVVRRKTVVKPEVFYYMMAKAIKYYSTNGVMPGSVSVAACNPPASWIAYGYVPPSSSVPAPAPVPTTAVIGKSFWIWGSEASSVGVQAVVDKAAANGIKDIFLLIKGASGTYSFTTLASMIPVAHAKNIKVHAWVICFNDAAAFSSGLYKVFTNNWIDPTDTNYRSYLLNTIIIPAIKNYAIDGICLDYVRYPGNANGNTAPINTFLASVKTQRDSLRPSAMVTAAVMPEMAANASIYGQDYAQMSQYCGALLPMTYTYNYNASATWVGDVVKYMLSKIASTCKVQAIIQTKSDTGVYKSGSAMDTERTIAVNAGSTSVSYFKWSFTTEQWASIAK